MVSRDSSNSYLKDHGIILLVKDHKENDKLVHVFLKNHGIVKAIAFGAKKSRKRFVSNLEPYQLGHFNIKRNQEQYQLQDIRIIRHFLNIRKDFTGLKMLFTISAWLTTRPLTLSEDIFKALYFLISKLDKNMTAADKIKYYLFFTVYFLKKEGVLSNSLACHHCGSTYEKMFFNSEHERLIFICESCRGPHKTSQIQPLPKPVLDFLTICLFNTRKINTAEFPYQVFSDIRSLINPLLINYLQMSEPILSFNTVNS